MSFVLYDCIYIAYLLIIHKSAIYITIDFNKIICIYYIHIYIKFVKPNLKKEWVGFFIIINIFPREYEINYVVILIKIR